MISSTDQLGQTHRFEKRPRRIVSLVPSITELLCDLGLQAQIVGCTKFCIHPTDIRSSATVVGGTKSLHIDRVIRLQPDLIIANKEENTLEIVDELRSICPVWVSDIPTVASSYIMIDRLSLLTDAEIKGQKIINNLKQHVNGIRYTGSQRVLYLIWKDPYMTIGADTYISNVLHLSGYKNAAISSARYPVISIEEIKRISPDCIFLSSEPYPFNAKDLEHLKVEIGNDKVFLVDGEYFSWYGSRMLKKPHYLKNLQEQLSKQKS